MADPDPRLADPAEVQSVLVAAAAHAALPDRLDAIGRAFEGRPYLAFSLVGGPDTPEERVTRLDGFDCVTFAESVIALATSARPANYPERLQALRYHHGRLTWLDRNHFMNRWIARNAEAGLVRPLLHDAYTDTGEVRELSCVPGYPVQRWPARYLPSEARAVLAARFQPGDVVAFVSDRSDLDTFHVGMLAPPPSGAAGPVGLRHAGRSAGRVVHEELDAFLARNAVRGMLLARPEVAVPLSGGAAGSE